MKNAGFLSSSLGIGNSHHKGTSLDHYVINRGWNMPELIFNQNPSQDNNNRYRFFECDHIHKWQSFDNSCDTEKSCYICNK